MRQTFKVPHEEDFHALELFQFEENALFVDIGANRGEAIQSILIKYPGKCRIVGFEPNPLIFKKLKDTYTRHKNIILHNTGLGNANHSINLFIPFYRNWMFDGLASFYHKEAAEWLKSRLWNFEKRHLTIKEITCHIKRLDDFQLTPDFIKIDVQGYELEVLKGAEKTIGKHNPILLLETPGKDIFNFLKRYGYNFYSYANGKFKKGNGSLNTFCLTEHKFRQVIKHQSQIHSC